MAQHLRHYCPARETGNEPLTRQNRKILRPVPPSKAQAAAPEIRSAEEFSATVKMPYQHVRWTPPVPQAKWLRSSIPSEGSVRAPPRERRPSQAPKKKIIIGCYASCARCNQCGACKRRECNGKCTGCVKCHQCREWGKLLLDGDPDAVATHEIEKAKPPVEKRSGGVTEAYKAKQAVGKNRPADAPKGSTPCPYCRKWLPAWHQEGCPSMPYEVWIAATRSRAVTKHGNEAIRSWRIQCQHCATPFLSPASKRVHLVGCERRRNQAGLPLNQYPVTRSVG